MKSNRDSVRKAREAYLIDRGQTLEPLSLIRRDEAWHFFRFFILRVCLYFFFCISFGICLVFSTFLFRIVMHLEFNVVRYPYHLSLCHYSIKYPAYVIYFSKKERDGTVELLLQDTSLFNLVPS